MILSNCLILLIALKTPLLSAISYFQCCKIYAACICIIKQQVIRILIFDEIFIKIIFLQQETFQATIKRLASELDEERELRKSESSKVEDIRKNMINENDKLISTIHEIEKVLGFHKITIIVML